MTEVNEFKRKEYQFRLDGRTHTVKHPSVKQVEDLQKETKEGDADIGKTIDFLSKLGLQKDVAYGMEPEHLQTIVEEISGAKKK